MPRLRHVNGAVVEVPKEKAESLLARGFTAEAEPQKASTKKSTSSKTSK